MERNQFEKELKSKIDAREIMPSDKAWDRLDAMLTVAEQRKPKRRFGWMHIAAGIAGFLFIGTIFFSQTEEVIDQRIEHEMVSGDKAEPISQNPKEEATIPVTESEAIASAASTATTKSKYNHQPKSNQNQSTINPVEAVNQIPDNQQLIASNNQQQSILNQKTEQLTAAKVDELLAATQNPGAKPKTSVKVNAKNLLSEVDHQVNLSFREKMLRRAGEVAEAVVNRNND